jgi:alkylhydroperoxidase family enzyme
MVVENSSQVTGTETTLPRIISNERKRYSMARITLVEPEQAPSEVKEIYDQKLKGRAGSAPKALAHRTSIINQCHYGLEHHPASSKRVGLTADDSKAVEGADNRRFTGKKQAALAYAEKLTRPPHSVNDADFTVRTKHSSDAEIVDLHLLTGLANLTNPFTDPLGLEVEFPEEKIQEQTR